MDCTHHAIRWKNRNGKVHGSYFFVLPIVLTAFGCGSRTGEISGKITYKGNPLTVPGGMVTFAHPTKGNFTGNITSEGGYTISNVPMGEVKIAVQSAVRRGKGGGKEVNSVRQKREEIMKSGQLKMSPEEREKMSPELAPAGPATVIPPSYTDPDKSGLTYTVTSGKQTHDIELK
jgi:hypothetical protein